MLLVLLPLPAEASHDKSDTVKLDDGGVYVGEIKSLSGATLNLHTNAASTIAIEWRHVQSLASKFEYRVETTGRHRHYGSLASGDAPRELKIITSSGTEVVAFDDVFEIEPIEHGF